jgi:hypothetical protein
MVGIESDEGRHRIDPVPSGPSHPKSMMEVRMLGCTIDSSARAKHIFEMEKYGVDEEYSSCRTICPKERMTFTLKKYRTMRKIGPYRNSIPSCSTTVFLSITECRFDEPWNDAIRMIAVSLNMSMSYKNSST